MFGRKLALIGAGTALVLAGGSTAAFAGTTGGGGSYPPPAQHEHHGQKHHGQRCGFEAFKVVSHDENAEKNPVKAYGVFDARGVDVVKSDNKDVFYFRQGALDVTHKATSDKLSHHGSHYRNVEFGRYWITDGTKRFRDAKGQGRYEAVATWEQKSDKDKPKCFKLVIEAQGSLCVGHERKN